MARLNEVPMASDSFETLRRKMLRQNRDLAKSNNVRALRIRELEGECALMLSENFELRSRILELEKKVEDNESRRIADHAMAIKARLEAQLQDWSMLISGLGLEPPLKRQSPPPSTQKHNKQRMSFDAIRHSPPRRRLRDIASQIEGLGFIAERTSSRQSLNPSEIRALQIKADVAVPQSPVTSSLSEAEPAKHVPSVRPQPTLPAVLDSKRPLEPLVALHSPKASKTVDVSSLSPGKRKTEPLASPQKPSAHVVRHVPEYIEPPVKLGAKRKFAQDEYSNNLPRATSDENAPPCIPAGKASLRQKAGTKTLKELAQLRKESREKYGAKGDLRKPLASKSTNDDVGSPKKPARPVASDELVNAKKEMAKPRPIKEQSNSKIKSDAPVKIKAADVAKAYSAAACAMSDLSAPVSDPGLTSPKSPDQPKDGDETRDDTPPPAHISSSGEISRPSRRNRATVSYAEPNLRDKMRRPTKELFDAVTGEGKYARRASSCDQQVLEGAKAKREPSTGDAICCTQVHDGDSNLPNLEKGDHLTSPLAKKESSLDQATKSSTERLRRMSAARNQAAAAILDPEGEGSRGGGVDVYEFASSSPQADKDESLEASKSRRQSGATTRRRSAAVDSAKIGAAKEKGASRRRSMMV